MIDEEATFKEFKYHSSDLTPQSHKPIKAACDLCGKIRITSKNGYHSLCVSCAMKGRIPTEETKALLSVALKGNTCAFGHTVTEEAKNQMSGKNNPNWCGGHSSEPYCSKFNAVYKRKIRERFNNVCFLCCKSAEENEEALSVHHVVFNKNCGCDGSKCVCVPLCKSCHMKTNGKREYWMQKIKNKLKETLLGY